MDNKEKVSELVKEYAKIEATAFAEYIHKYFPNKAGDSNKRTYMPAFFEDRIAFREYSIDEIYGMFLATDGGKNGLKFNSK